MRSLVSVRRSDPNEEFSEELDDGFVADENRSKLEKCLEPPRFC